MPRATAGVVRSASWTRFDSMMRNFFEMFLRARLALEFSHRQDPELAMPRSSPLLAPARRHLTFPAFEQSEKW
jgi:hypothetical protein